MKVKVLNFYQTKSDGTEFKPDYFERGPRCFFWFLSGSFLGHPDYFIYLSHFFIIQPGLARWQKGKKDHRSKCYMINNYLMFYLYKRFISIYFNLYSLFCILPPGDRRANKGSAANITCWSISPHPTLFQYIQPTSSFFSSSPSLSSW